jgi:hypothetical protein
MTIFFMLWRYGLLGSFNPAAKPAQAGGEGVAGVFGRAKSMAEVFPVFANTVLQSPALAGKSELFRPQLGDGSNFVHDLFFLQVIA